MRPLGGLRGSRSSSGRVPRGFSSRAQERLIAARCRQFRTMLGLCASRDADNRPAAQPPLRRDWSAGWQPGRSEGRWARREAVRKPTETQLLQHDGAPYYPGLQTTPDTGVPLQPIVQAVEETCRFGSDYRRQFGPSGEWSVHLKERCPRVLQLVHPRLQLPMVSLRHSHDQQRL